jgi:hypothetical protein
MSDLAGLVASKLPDLVVNLIASAIAVIIVLWIERSKRPKIEFEIEPDALILENDNIKRKFLRLRVHNRSMHPLLDFFYTRSPALSCRVSIVYLRDNNALVFRPGHRQIGRWSTTPEPVLTVMTPSGIAHVRDLSQTRDTMDIPPGTFELLDVVMRTSVNEHCIGWHNRIIANREPSDDDTFTLEKGVYRVVVTLRTDGRDYIRVFRIVNDVGFQHFRLEELPTQPAAKLLPGPG